MIANRDPPNKQEKREECKCSPEQYNKKMNKFREIIAKNSCSDTFVLSGNNNNQSACP